LQHCDRSQSLPPVRIPTTSNSGCH